jgi:hypothetical protein
LPQADPDFRPNRGIFLSACSFWKNQAYMANESPSRAAELAAEQVESIVSAANAAAEELKEAARLEAEALRARGQEEAVAELDEARKRVLQLGEEARREAQTLREDAEKESAQIRDQTRRAVEGRVAAAEEVAAEVLAEARTLSSGLQRLGELLGDQGERILREVQAAHRRMQADLSVARPEGESRREPLPPRREAATPRLDRPRRPARRNPIEDLDVPGWVEPGS